MPWPLTALTLLAALGFALPTAATAQRLAITDVTVIDVREGRALPDMTVVVSGDRIARVGTVGQVEVPADARVIDGTGRFLIPGLWDMHVHTTTDRNTREIIFPLLVAHGITGIRSMAADCFETGEPNCEDEGTSAVLATINDARRWLEEIATGTLVGPRIVAGSFYVNSPGPGEVSTSQYPGTSEHGREHARLLHERGVDFIKIYDMLSRDAYFALAEEANRLGLPFAGHVPVAVRASEAARVGQRSIEHLGAGNVLEECSSHEAELRQQVISELQSEQPDLLPLLLEMVHTHDPEKCALLAEGFVRNGTWVVPTLMVARLPSELGEGWREDPYARFLPPDERRYFEWSEETYEEYMGSPEMRSSYSRWVREITGTLHRAGVRMLAGSDAGVPDVFWGVGLHQELELLVSAGLTEAQALQAATLGPAEFLGATDSLGTVDEGKLADLVLLDANPLDDISNTQRIAAVVVNGRYTDRKMLDQLLAGAEAAAHETDTVQVAPPTGVPDTDRASILAALDEVAPGGAVQFGPGLYLVGPILRIDTSGITLLGDSEGTVLRGCELDEYEAMELEFSAAIERDGMDVDPGILERCGQFHLTGGNVTVRGLTFEQSRLGIVLGCCEDDQVLRSFAGGYVIEGNTFRNTGNSIRAWLQSEEPTFIRGNAFTNTFHALSANGSRIHFVDNRVSVPEPTLVPFETHPGFGVAIGGRAVEPGDGEVPPVEPCMENVVSGNQIEGHPDALVLIAPPGIACRNNLVRDNRLVANRVPRPEVWRLEDILPINNPDDPTFVGLPLRLWGMDGEGLPSEIGGEGLASGRFEGTRVEGNRILDADGLGIQLINASRSRLSGNTISGIRLRDPYPGNNPGMPGGWEAANGSGIWLSPGSDENEIEGNTFEDVATHAVVMEGDRNRVRLERPADSVRDLGTGNRVGGPDATVPLHESPSRFVDAGGVSLHDLDFGGEGLSLVFVHSEAWDARTFAELAPRFADRNRDLAVARPGYGESEAHPDGFGVDVQARALVAFLDAMDVDRAVFAGNAPVTSELTSSGRSVQGCGPSSSRASRAAGRRSTNSPSLVSGASWRECGGEPTTAEH